MGGMTKAVEAGIPKLRIEESARGARLPRPRRRRHCGRQRFRPGESALDVRDIDNTLVRRDGVPRSWTKLSSNHDPEARGGSRGAEQGRGRPREPLELVEEAAGPRDGRRDFRGDGERVLPPRAQSARSPASRAAYDGDEVFAAARRDRASPTARAGVRACWWPSSARTATTAAPR